jgi:hypothetical protein
MSSRLLSQEHGRLNLPHEASPPRRIPPATGEGVATLHASRRAWLAGLTGGLLSPPGRPDPSCTATRS